MAQKILVIDDDQVNVQLVQSRLQANGYEVISALDGEAGLRKVKSEQPDLVILDVQMPKMNGYTFMTEYKRIGAAAPVIVLTAHQEMQPIFTLKGVRGYLVKPLKIENLLEKIKECIGSE